MTHFLLTYAVCGIAIMLVVATVDLFTPQYPPMGVRWTLVYIALWPLFLGVVAVFLFKRYSKKI